MIEGLRLLPWLREATRRNPNAVGHLSDCARCMSSIPRPARQAMACAWEEPIADAQAWEPEGYTGPSPKTCPGYTTKLPEVIEVAEARFYLHHGSLSLLVGGELSDGLRDGIAILESAEAEVASWSARNPEKK